MRSLPASCRTLAAGRTCFLMPSAQPAHNKLRTQSGSRSEQQLDRQDDGRSHKREDETDKRQDRQSQQHDRNGSYQ